MTDIDKNVFADILGGLVESVDRETPDVITYKDFMSANKDDTLYDIFNTYDMAASQPSQVVSKILKQKFGITRMDDELYWFIREFPVYIDKLSHEIKKNEGSVCCVDKAWQRAIDRLRKLIDANLIHNKGGSDE